MTVNRNFTKLFKKSKDRMLRPSAHDVTADWCRHLANSTEHPMTPFYVTTWRHPQNRKYITYCIVVREGPSHGHMYRVQKIWWNLDVWLIDWSLLLIFVWDMGADRRTCRQPRHSDRVRSNNMDIADYCRAPMKFDLLNDIVRIRT